MATLVVYASRHGATEEMARRIATVMETAGRETVLRRARDAGNISAYDSFVIGSAVYLGNWLKEATAFIAAHEHFLATRPVWLFSSGPLRPTAGDDALITAMPRQFAAYKEILHPRGMRIFSGALEPGALSFSERVMRTSGTGRRLLPAGDFRDWIAIDAWAGHIAHVLGAETPALPAV